MIKIALAEDNPYLAKSLIGKIENATELKLKHVSSNGKELLQNLEEDVMVDVILMDIEMPEMNGIDATKIINAKYPQIKILMLTVFDDDDNLFNAIKAGANGYLLKDEPFEKLLESIVNIKEGGAPMTGSMALKALKLLRNPIAELEPKEDYNLSKREVEVLEQICRGLTYTEIAENLIISPNTVRKHIENVYQKLNVHSKYEAINVAKKNRLV